MHAFRFRLSDDRSHVVGQRRKEGFTVFDIVNSLRDTGFLNGVKCATTRRVEARLTASVGCVWACVEKTGKTVRRKVKDAGHKATLLAFDGLGVGID